MIKSVRVMKKGGTLVRYESGKLVSYSGKNTPKSVLKWILETDTIGHDSETDIFYTK